MDTIGIDLGGTTFNAAFINEAGAISHNTEQDTQQHDGPERLLPRIAETALQVLVEACFSRYDQPLSRANSLMCSASKRALSMGTALYNEARTPPTSRWPASPIICNCAASSRNRFSKS